MFLLLAGMLLAWVSFNAPSLNKHVTGLGTVAAWVSSAGVGASAQREQEPVDGERESSSDDEDERNDEPDPDGEDLEPLPLARTTLTISYPAEIDMSSPLHSSGEQWVHLDPTLRPPRG